MPRLLAATAGLAALVLAGAAAADPITVTDILGREVTIDGPADRVVLGEGRLIVTLALLTPDPVALLAGWTGEYRQQDPATYGVYLAKYPRLADVPVVGNGQAAGFSAEQTIAAQPDVVIFAGENSPSNPDDEIVKQIEAADIPVVFVDFFRDPVDDTVPSIRILGQLLGQTGPADALADLWQSHLDHVTQTLAAANAERPNVFMEAHAGLSEQCCFSPGHGTLGDMIEVAGGHNIGADVLPGPTGQLNLEFILSQDAPFYIATGGAHLANANGLVMGPGYDEATVREALARMTARPGIADLTAVKEGHVLAIWHLFNDVPLSIIAIEEIAKFLHPDLFADLDPAATLAEINDRFLAVPLDGTYWLALTP